MLNRRDFLQVAFAATALTGLSGRPVRAAARQAITQDDLLQFEPVGQVTLLHITDIHAQLVPLYFREPSVNLGVGEVHGLPPPHHWQSVSTTFWGAGTDRQRLCADKRRVSRARQDLRQGGRGGSPCHLAQGDTGRAAQSNAVSRWW